MGHHEEPQLSTHLLAAIPRGTYAECFEPERDPIWWNLVANRPPLRDGQLELSDRPGLGWELDPKYVKRHRLPGRHAGPASALPAGFAVVVIRRVLAGDAAEVVDDQRVARVRGAHCGLWHASHPLVAAARAAGVRDLRVLHASSPGPASLRSTAAMASLLAPGRPPPMAIEERRLRVALAGDTMLGRQVGRMIARSRRPPVAAEVLAAAAEADLFVLNLECCISDRGHRWPDPRKPFFFRAPPLAAELLAHMGVDCVTLANNHALDYGPQALLDTLDHLSAAGIAWVGAGPDAANARAPRLLAARGIRLAVLGASDHPAAFAAGPDRPGIAYADLRDDPRGGWLADAVVAARRDADAVLVTPHWGPNMTVRPSAAIRQAAHALLAAGATLVAGHSAHIPHGTERGVLYDLGDFVDDYAVDPRLRNDLGLLFLIDLDAHGPRRLEAVALTLEHCHTRIARGDDADRIRRRFIGACAELGTAAIERDGRVVVSEFT
jgi:capsule synthesis protein PGA_cap